MIYVGLDNVDSAIYEAFRKVPHKYYDLQFDDGIFTERAKGTFLSLPETERERYLEGLVSLFFKEHPDFDNFYHRQIFDEPEHVLSLFEALTETDFKKANIDLDTSPDGQLYFSEVFFQVEGSPDDEVVGNFVDIGKYEVLQERINVAKTRIKEIEGQEKKDLNALWWALIEVRDIFTISELANLYNNKLSIIDAQIKGREDRRQLKHNAEKAGAIMGLKGGTLITFSSEDLREAFHPNRITKMGELPREVIDPKTGYVDKQSFNKGDLIGLKASEVNYSMMVLLTSIIGNSVNNPMEELIKDGEITFYVQGVLDTLKKDPRSYFNNKMSRKEAAVLLIENELKPLQEFVGVMPDKKSRYAVLNYKGYDAKTDTITIESPYLYQCWNYSQRAKFARIERVKERENNNKKPLKEDLIPMETNRFFKDSAMKDPLVFQIATYITTSILQAGGKLDKEKKTEIYVKTIINKCPLLKERLHDIENKQGRKVNKSDLYNKELRKIKKAFEVIQNRSTSDFLNSYEIVGLSPARQNKETRTWELIAPTKGTINEKIVILWKKIKE